MVSGQRLCGSGAFGSSAIYPEMPRLKTGLCPALTPVVMEKLSKIGVHNIIDIIIADLDELSQKSKVSYKVADYRPRPDMLTKFIVLDKTSLFRIAP